MKKYIVIVGIIALAFIGGYLTKSFYGNDKLQKELKVNQSLIIELDKQKDSLLKSIKEKDELYSTKQLEVDQLHALISVNDKSLLDEKNKIEEAVKEYEESINTIDIKSISDYDRCKRLCANREKLGYSCPASYCEKYK